MKELPFILATVLLLPGALVLPSMGENPDPVRALFPPPAESGPVAATLAASPSGSDLQMEKALLQMQKEIATIEARLGLNSRPPSVTYNVERRLADLEKRVQQLEQQLARLQQFDQRIRRLETK